MRVIAGTARHLLLDTPAGMETRPTTDRIKETLFNILQPDLYGARFLDLFSGSGGIGIEALSRGAHQAVFVDNSREAIRCIRTNLERTRFTDSADIYAEDILSAIQKLSVKGESFDVIFMDPPYKAGLEYAVMDALSGSPLVKKHTLLIVESLLHNDLPEASSHGFHLTRIKTYKTNQHLFFTAQMDGEENA